MEPTVLVYSSHDRCARIHGDWIVERALRGNRRILFLPLSASTDDADSEHHQRYNWDTFRWFFDRYRDRRLEAFPFFWNPDLGRDDVERCFDALASAEVVILGGGRPPMGMRRFEELGRRFHGDPDRFQRVLYDRKRRGLLTVGYSAGIDQLCELMSTESSPGRATPGFGLARQVMAVPHFGPGQEGWVFELARAFPACLVFGLPNDSALAVAETTVRGQTWQVIRVIADSTWDRPEDADHIKTRWGVKIPHSYADGRTWGFNDGDQLVRTLGGSGTTPGQIFIAPAGRPIFDYHTQTETESRLAEEILGDR